MGLDMSLTLKRKDGQAFTQDELDAYVREFSSDEECVVWQYPDNKGIQIAEWRKFYELDNLMRTAGDYSHDDYVVVETLNRMQLLKVIDELKRALLGEYSQLEDKGETFNYEHKALNAYWVFMHAQAFAYEHPECEFVYGSDC